MLNHHYYARNEQEKTFDNSIRDTVKHSGTNVEMALYIQNQTILSMLRKLDDKLETIAQAKNEQKEA